MVELALKPIPTSVARKALGVRIRTRTRSGDWPYRDGYNWPDDVDGRGIRIAIVDMGIDDSHSEIAGKNPEGWGADCTKLEEDECSIENPEEYDIDIENSEEYGSGHGTWMAIRWVVVTLNRARGRIWRYRCGRRCVWQLPGRHETNTR